MFERIAIKAVTAGTAAVLALVAAGCGSAQDVGGVGEGGAPQTPAAATPAAATPAAGASEAAPAPVAGGPDTESVTCYKADGSAAGVAKLDRAQPGVRLTDAEKQSLCARNGWSATR
ncbi:hypothetical protein [Streptomyces sp. NPDC096339]|uniref:hypothetical protein n=1 Tax=Streptomyces sp. NPDC096339 TaxID=3366086 RepID=UPI0037F768B8